MRTLLVSCCLLAVVLTGCGDPNAGEQKIADFRAWLGEHPVEGLSLESSEATDALPWVGNGEVTLLVEDPLDLVSAAEHACDYNTTHASVGFVAHVGAVHTPFTCEDGGLADLEEGVQALNAVRGLQSAEIDEDGAVEASFRTRRQLVAAYPSLADDYAAVSASTSGLDVIDDGFADDDVRDALVVQVSDLDRLVRQVAASSRSGTTPSGISVVTFGRPGRVRRHMEALTPGVPITVVAD